MQRLISWLALVSLVSLSACVGISQPMGVPPGLAVSTPSLAPTAAETVAGRPTIAAEAATTAPESSPIVIAPAASIAVPEETAAAAVGETPAPAGTPPVAGEPTAALAGAGGPAPTDQIALLAGGPPVVLVSPDGGEPRPIGGENMATYGALYFRLSPDRRSIVYSAEAELWLLDVASGKSKQLTADDRWHLMPAWSPDGRLIAEVSRPLLPDETKDGWMTGEWGGALATMQADGSEFRVLDEDGIVVAPPSWAPEGHRVAYAAGGKLRIYDVIAGQRQELKPADFGLDAEYIDGPSWSPDGTRLAVYFAAGLPAKPEDIAAGSAVDVEQGVAVLDLQARRATVLMTWSGILGGEPPALRWQPGGTRLLIDVRPGPSSSQQPRLWLADPATGRKLDLGMAAYDAAWSPDGGRIAAIDLDDRQRLAVFVVDSAGGAGEPVVRAWEVSLEGLEWR